MQTGIAIVLKYFVIFDILTNFISKINVELTPFLDDQVKSVQRLEFPNLGFLESTSILRDGGGDQDEDYYDQKKREREEVNVRKMI